MGLLGLAGGVILGLAILLALWAAADRGPAGGRNGQPPAGSVDARPALVMYRPPTCACCTEHAGYLRVHGFPVRSVDTDGMDQVKRRLSIPPEMRSCHTITVGGYFIEGHVPVEAIVKLLEERPPVAGIALPGMPPGSPGMGGERTGPLVIYAVSPAGVRVFARL